MSKQNDFSIAMSVLLLQIRGEELLGEELVVDTGRPIESEYVDNVLDNEEDCILIKNNLRLSILKAIRNDPKYCFVNDDFNPDGGHYEYHPDLMEFTSIVDDYIIMKWEQDNPTFKEMVVCDQCGSSNLKVKIWVDVNSTGLVDMTIDGTEDEFYCEDCVGEVEVSLIKKNVLHKIIGYQVVNSETNNVHPAYDDNKFSSLWFARDILDKLNDDRFGLKTIWTDTLECPNYVKHS